MKNIFNDILLSTKTIFCIIILAITLKVYCQDNLQTSQKITENLEESFLNPPDYAKPRVFWWWLNSMATKESITRDLEELKEKGFGGALIYDGGSSNYEIAKKTKAGPVFGSPEWIDNFLFALKEAERLGLEMSFTIQSGWNPGGPTVQPEHALKKIVWSETIVEGPCEYSNLLPIPEGEYYNDIVIQAFPYDEQKEKTYLMSWEYKTFNKRFKGFNEYPLYIMREQNDSLINDYDLKNDSCIDITGKVNGKGILTWQVPEGKYKILRIGNVLTGAEVSTPSDGYYGLSIDHLNTEALELFFRESVDPILNKAKKYIGKSLKYLQTDSWEMGSVNWSKELREEFIQRRGYDPLPYLATLTGQIVDSREVSNRFLYDYRKTIGDCVADRHYKIFSKLAEERGLKIHPESGGPHAAPIDGLKCLGRNDFPMGEFWARSNTHRFKEEHRLFVKQSASAAHIYGKRFVAAEGPTSIGPQWERSPKDLKSVIDRNFCEGINRFFWHSFTSSPQEFGLPGNEYFAGTHFNPNVTWWNQSKPFVDYLARGSYLLSQGLFCADVLIYYGDDVPVFANRKKNLGELGFGYDYDDCNAEVILNNLEVKNGKLVLPDGMSYHILRLPDRDAITLNVLEKIEKLVYNGATVVGQKPTKATGLEGYPESDIKVKEIADRLWTDCNGTAINENNYGKGKVVWGKPMRDILLSKKIEPDFTFVSSQDSAQIDFIHRSAHGVEIYYVVNRLARKGIYDTNYRYIPELPDRYERIDCSFNVEGKVPEIWNPMTGNIEEAVVFKEENGRTIVPLLLEPEGSSFVIFRKEANQSNICSVIKDDTGLFPLEKAVVDKFFPNVIKEENNQQNLEIFEPGNYKLLRTDKKVFEHRIEDWENEIVVEGEWQVSFNEKWGAPEKVNFQKLISWTDSDIDGIKYYSGTAEYKKTITLHESVCNKEARFYMDLGNVQELAELNVNGKNMGVIWMPPFIADITDAVKPGENEIIIKVTNLWPNRLIGDQNLPENKRFTKTNIQKFKKDDPLRISGLLGPVKIIISKVVDLKK